MEQQRGKFTRTGMCIAMETGYITDSRKENFSLDFKLSLRFWFPFNQSHYACIAPEFCFLVFEDFVVWFWG